MRVGLDVSNVELECAAAGATPITEQGRGGAGGKGLSKAMPLHRHLLAKA